MALVPANFVARDKELLPGLGVTYANSDVNSAYYSFDRKEFAMGLKHWLGRTNAWLNYFEFSSVIPKAEGIELVSAWWDKPVSLETALADERWGFRAEEQVAFPGYLELKPRNVKTFPAGSTQ